MIPVFLCIVMVAPAVAALLCIAVRAPRVVEILNLFASAVCFACAVPLAVMSAAGPYHYWDGYVVLDMPGSWVLLCSAIVYLLASIYSVGYMRLLDEDEKLWSFYALFATFALTVLLSTVMNNAGLYWI